MKFLYELREAMGLSDDWFYTIVQLVRLTAKDSIYLLKDIFYWSLLLVMILLLPFAVVMGLVKIVWKRCNENER